MIYLDSRIIDYDGKEKREERKKEREKVGLVCGVTCTHDDVAQFYAVLRSVRR